MSRPRYRLAAALVVAAVFTSRFAQGDTAIPEPSLHTYATADGTAYFALNLVPNVPVADAGPRDVVILFDTSASQTGLIRQKAIESLEALVADLRSDDRVLLLAVDLEAVPMSRGWMAAGGPEIKGAFAALAARVPLGATDMQAALGAALASFDAGSKAPRVVAYIGDGLSSANFMALDDYRKLVDALVARRVSVSSYAIGPRLDSQLLASLANQTGGMLVIDDDSIDPKQAAGFLAKSVRAGVLWPTKVTWPDAVAEVFPERMPPLRTDRDTVVLGKMSGAASP